MESSTIISPGFTVVVTQSRTLFKRHLVSCTDCGMRAWCTWICGIGPSECSNGVYTLKDLLDSQQFLPIRRWGRRDCLRNETSYVKSTTTHVHHHHDDHHDARHDEARFGSALVRWTDPGLLGREVSHIRACKIHALSKLKKGKSVQTLLRSRWTSSAHKLQRLVPISLSPPQLPQDATSIADATIMKKTLDNLFQRPQDIQHCCYHKDS
jgi:hypothetical protein